MKKIFEPSSVDSTYQLIVNLLIRLRDDMKSDDINPNFKDDLENATNALEIVKTYY